MTQKEALKKQVVEAIISNQKTVPVVEVNNSNIVRLAIDSYYDK